jgi:glycosyltransferase involved in cell wall biosynthesis
VLEALAASSIAVISALPGYQEAAAGHAIEFPPGDVSGLREALCQALQAARSGEGVGSRAAMQAARDHGANWSMDRLAELYEAAYGQVIAGSGK